MENRFNLKNPILDYEQVNSILESMIKDENGKEIVRQDPIGFTEFNYPIEHYTIGEGKNNIVFAGCTHGSEIITTDFILQLMHEIKNNKEKFDFLNDDYCLHFIPILNPEGYIITTSAIRTIIDKDMELEEMEKICKEYFSKYREDDINARKNPSDRGIKLYQEMFKDIGPDCIGEKHKTLREKIKKVIDDYDQPAGSLIAWSSNGSGVDINANMYSNSKISSCATGETVYGGMRYNNIKTSKPGPIGCPTNTNVFAEQPETTAITDFLVGLSQETNLCGYITYHSTGGMIYHKPYNPKDDMGFGDFSLKCDRAYNERLAKTYQKDTNYKLMGDEPFTSSNELLRVMIPGDILVELSKMGGNPIGPYGDMEGNYIPTIENNISAVARTVKIMPEIKKVRDEFFEEFKESKGHKKENILDRFLGR